MAVESKQNEIVAAPKLLASTVRPVNKGHRGHEERTLTTSRLLNDYLELRVLTPFWIGANLQESSRLNGAFLTTIGSMWGTSAGQFRGPSEITLDGTVNVHATDRINGRIQKLPPAYRQTALAGVCAD